MISQMENKAHQLANNVFPKSEIEDVAESIDETCHMIQYKIDHTRRYVFNYIYMCVCVCVCVCVCENPCPACSSQLATAAWNANEVPVSLRTSPKHSHTNSCNVHCFVRLLQGAETGNSAEVISKWVTREKSATMQVLTHRLHPFLIHTK